MIDQLLSIFVLFVLALYGVIALIILAAGDPVIAILAVLLAVLISYAFWR